MEGQGEEACLARGGLRRMNMVGVDAPLFERGVTAFFPSICV